MKALLKTGEIIEIVPNDDFCAAKYINKETSEYIFDDEIAEILTGETSDVKNAATEYEHNRVYESELENYARYLDTLEDGETPVMKEPSPDTNFILNADIIDAFIAGAKWDRQQMMSKAVEGEVRKDGTIGYFEFSNEQQFHSLLEQFQDCDKVRIIIIKEDEK